MNTGNRSRVQIDRRVGALACVQKARHVGIKTRCCACGCAGERPVAQVSPPAQYPGAPPDEWEHATPSCPEHAVQLLLSKA